MAMVFGVYPRECGATETASSYRARRARTRSIPASAGQPFKDLGDICGQEWAVYPRECGATVHRMPIMSRVVLRAVYPRECGATYANLRVIERLASDGLSPRVRGNLWRPEPARYV